MFDDQSSAVAVVAAARRFLQRQTRPFGALLRALQPGEALLRSATVEDDLLRVPMFAALTRTLRNEPDVARDSSRRVQRSPLTQLTARSTTASGDNATSAGTARTSRTSRQPRSATSAPGKVASDVASVSSPALAEHQAGAVRSIDSLRQAQRQRVARGEHQLQSNADTPPDPNSRPSSASTARVANKQLESLTERRRRLRQAQARGTASPPQASRVGAAATLAPTVRRALGGALTALIAAAAADPVAGMPERRSSAPRQNAGRVMPPPEGGASAEHAADPDHSRTANAADEVRQQAAKHTTISSPPTRSRPREAGAAPLDLLNDPFEEMYRHGVDVT